MRLVMTLLLLAALPAVVWGEDRAQPPPSHDPAASSTGARPRADPVPAAAQELARALLPQQEWDRLLDHYASTLSSQVSESLLGQGEKVPDDLQGNIRKELGQRIAYGQIVESQAHALAGRFTPEELKSTADFYASPVGKKVLDRLPDAQSQVGEDLQARLATAVPEIVQRLAPKALAAPEEGTGSGAGGDRQGKVR
jgi:hypothetical protein